MSALLGTKIRRASTETPNPGRNPNPSKAVIIKAMTLASRYPERRDGPSPSIRPRASGTRTGAEKPKAPDMSVETPIASAERMPTAEPIRMPVDRPLRWPMRRTEADAYRETAARRGQDLAVQAGDRVGEGHDGDGDGGPRKQNKTCTDRQITAAAAGQGGCGPGQAGSWTLWLAPGFALRGWCWAQHGLPGLDGTGFGDPQVNHGLTLRPPSRRYRAS